MINNLFTFVRTLGNQRIEGKKFFTGQVGILGSLSDSSGSLGTAGKVLSTTGSGVQWITVGSSNVQSLNDLSDVIITTAATGQLLRFNGTNWVNWTHSFLDSSSTLGDLFNVGSSADGANDGDILRFNEQSGLWIADEFPSFTEVDTLDSVTGRGATTTNSITVGGVSTSGTVTAAVVTTPLIEREGVLTINSEQQVDQGEPNPNLLYVSWMGDNKFVINADGYAITNTGYKVVGGTASGFLKADGSIDTGTYLTSYTETQTLDDVTDLGATTTNAITVGGVTAPILEYGGLLTIDADSSGSLLPGQGDPAVSVLNFQWAGSTQGYIDTSGRITFSGFKTPLGTSSGFLKANGTVDTNAYITGVDYIDDIGDVNIVNPLAGEILQFDGAEWVNGQLPNFTYASKVQHEVKAGVAITKGQAVYVTSADGTNMIVGLASNASEATSSKTMGLSMQNLAINGHGFVITEGLLDGLNTSTATAGDPVWLGTGGNLIYGLTNKPIAPAHLVFIGIVTRSNANNGEIFVKVQNGFELSEIHDVLISSPSWGQLIRRDIDGLWKNWTPDFITPSSVNTLTNKTIPLGTGIATIVNIDSIDPFIGESNIPLYQDGINKGGTISIDAEGNISISNPGIGYHPGQVNTEGGTRFSITITGNIVTGSLAEFNEALTDGLFATETYVNTAIANLVDSAPSTLNTLNELAAALGDDPNFATTVATAIGTKQNQLNGTGFVKASGTTITYDNSTYLTTESDPVFTASAAYGITSEQITSWDTAYGWGNHAEVGYLTSFTETDPIFTASAASTITTEQIGFWDEAYGWGNHALAGYLTELPPHDHNDLYYTETESDIRFYLATNPSGYQTTSGTVANIASGSTTNLNSAWTAEGTSIANGFRVYRYNSDAANKPVTADNANWLINIFSHPSGGAASYGHQLAAANTNNIYFRSVSNGTFSDWHKFWSTNDFSSTTVIQWNTAYGWGNHASAGYLTSIPDEYLTQTEADGIYQPIGTYLTAEADTLSTVTSRGNSTVNGISVGSLSVPSFIYLTNGGAPTFISENWGINLNGQSTQPVQVRGASLGVGYTLGGGTAYGTNNLFVAGNIGVGTYTPTYKLHVAGNAYINETLYVNQHTTIEDNLSVTNGINQNNLIGRPSNAWGASGNTTGAVVIEFPGGSGNYGMIHAVIDIYEYSGNNVCTIIIGGHNWDSRWYSYGANVIGSTNKDVRLGFKDGKYCIMIGRADSSWSYGQVVLRKIQNGSYYQGVMSVYDGYDIYQTTDDSTDWISGDLRGLVVPGAISANGGNSNNWNTAYGWGNHALAGYAAASSLSNYLPLAGGTMTGNLTLKYSTADSSDYEGLMFAPYNDVAGLNDYIIKAASDRGVFGRKSFGWHVHTNSAFGVYSNGWVKLFGVEGGTGNTQVFGNLTVSGTITESSSIRYKKDIVDIEPSSSRIELLRPVRYKKIKDESEEIGLIAEDVAELFPEVVKYDKEGRPDGVNYSRLSVILLKAVQELTERVNKLENK